MKTAHHSKGIGLPRFRFQAELLGLFLVTVLTQTVSAQGTVDQAPPDGREAAAKQMAGFRVPPGLRVELYAAEPDLASPVAIGLDERNRVFVAEEFRFNRGTEENRTRSFLLEDDLQVETLEDRRAMFAKHLSQFEGGWDWFTKYTDRVRLLEDTNGDGKADRSQVFADGFNDVLDGMIAGVHAFEGDVYVTCIPHLWRLRDQDGDGVAESKEKLLTGFGVNAGFLGHDLHGLVWGPDGKLYFSVGDRGFDVTSKEGKRHSLPRRGAVFRCYPDGSDFEVVHVGLRNPQELAFDDFGNLFADDNNCDKGDDARLVYVVEGGDSGWNMAFQHIPEPYLTGPWFAERLWEAESPDQPGWLLPRVGKIGAGPSGFAYYPGTGLPDSFRGRFFMCNYTGNGGIETFSVKPKGAGFELVDTQDFLKPIFATDLEFGFDGKIYVSDFVALDWSGLSKGGRVYTVTSEDQTIAAGLADVMKTPFKQKESRELRGLLAHPDQRIRLRAQFAIANRGEEGLAIFQSTLDSDEVQRARLHALWGIGQLSRTSPTAKTLLGTYLSSTDVEIQAHAARLVGDHKCVEHERSLIELLSNSSPRVQFFAAQSLGKLNQANSIPALIEFAAAFGEQDPYLRHAAIWALQKIGDREQVASYLHHEKSIVRRVVLLAMRHWRDERITQFLSDSEPQIVLEAARIINDLPLNNETEQLAELASALEKRPELMLDPLLRRIINANFRVGGESNVAAVAKLAGNPLASLEVRREAWLALKDWSKPGNRDRVTGDWRPLDPREPAILDAGLPTEELFVLLGAADPALRTVAIDVVAARSINGNEELLLKWVNDSSFDYRTRVASIQLLHRSNYPEIRSLMETGLSDSNANYRAALLTLIGQIDANWGEKLALEILSKNSSVIENQSSLRILGASKNEVAKAKLQELLTLAESDKKQPEILFEILEGLGRNPLEHREAILFGGDAERGKQVFAAHGRAQCVRCHRTPGSSGGDAGPQLNAKTAEQGREHLLDSLINPDLKIANGFGVVTFALTDGRLESGVVQEETADKVVLLNQEKQIKTILTSEIEERSNPKSPMPNMSGVLSVKDMRDLVEYLSNLPSQAE